MLNCVKSQSTGYPDIKLNTEQMSLIVAKVDDLHTIYWSPTGVSDLQLPVLAPIIPPALAAGARAVSDETLLEVVRTAAHLTHVDAQAIAAGEFVALLLKDLMSGAKLLPSIETRLNQLPEDLAKGVRGAIDRSWNSTVEAARELGMSCALAEGLPLGLVTLLRANSYADAVRTTILMWGRLLRSWPSSWCAGGAHLGRR